MCFATLALAAGVAGGAISAGGALEGGAATANAANYSAAVASNNSIIAKQNADYAEKAGLVQAQNQSLKGRSVGGKIRAAQGASGVDVNSGSNLDVREAQREAGQLDTETVLNNAELSAYGYRNQATSFDAQSKLDKLTAEQAPIGAEIGAAGSLLSSASSLGFKWSTMGSGGGGGGIGSAGPFGFNPIRGVSGQ